MVKKVVCTRKLLELAVILTFISKYFTVPLPTTKTTIFLPLKITTIMIVSIHQFLHRAHQVDAVLPVGQGSLAHWVRLVRRVPLG